MGDEEQEIGSKAIVEMLFGEDLGKRMAEAEGSYRKILEPTPAVTQCKRAGKEFQAGLVCYICGVEIPAKEGRSTDDNLYPECEHILPVGQARAFLDIYTHIDVTTFMDASGIEWYKKAIELEYAQAHRLCNQTKKDKSFIGNPSLKATEVKFDKAKTERILNNIIKKAESLSNNPNLGPSDKNIYSKIARMKEKLVNRVESIKKIIDNISAHIGKRNPAEADLLMLSRVGALIHPERLPTNARSVYEKTTGIIRDPVKEFKTTIRELYPELTSTSYNRYFYGKYNPIPEEVRIDLNERIDSILKEIYDHYSVQDTKQELSPILAVEYISFKSIIKEYIDKGGKYDEGNAYWLNFVINTMNNMRMKKYEFSLFDSETEKQIKGLEDSIRRDERSRQKEGQAQLNQRQQEQEQEDQAAEVLYGFQYGKQGGLRRRFHFKQNARISHLGNLRSTKHSRLRKRTRKGRTYRLRQRSGKPKTRRQRKSLGGVRLA
jgi:hypothetical protein